MDPRMATKKKTPTTKKKKAAKKKTKTTAAKKKTAPSKKKKRGRPTDYTDEIGAEICVRLMDKESLRSICQDTHLPSKTTVFRWLASPEHVEFRDQYARARENQGDILFDEIHEVAQDRDKDYIEVYEKDKSGKKVLVKIIQNSAKIQGDALKIDTLKWLCGKLRPKKYGPKIDVGGKVEFKVGLAKKIEEGFGRVKHGKTERGTDTTTQRRSRGRQVVRGNRAGAGGARSKTVPG